jgi:uncharacterized protein
MTTDSRIAVVQDFLHRYFSGDVSSASVLLEDDVTFHIPGRHAASGVFQGLKAASDHLANVLRLTQRSIDVLKWEDWLVGVGNVAGLAMVHLQHRGQMHDFRVIFLVTVTERGKIGRFEVFFSDQAALDRFFWASDE